MSISSNDSLFDDDDNVLVDDNEEIDYYVVLNVSKDATLDEINKAYKSRCLLFHPDRHTDEQSKKDAEKMFVKLRKAHETLSDSQKRSIYDAVGPRGLEMQGWQLVSKSHNVENIRKEYEFLKRLRETEIMMQRVHPTGTFQAKVNAAGLWCENPEERYPPSLVGISISQGVDTAVSASDRIGLAGRVKSLNGRGDGQVSASWKRSISSSLHLETLCTFGVDSLGAQTKLTKSISPKVMIAISPNAQYLLGQDVFDCAMTATLSLFLGHNWQGSVACSYGMKNSFISSTVMCTELNHPKFSFNLTVSPVNSFIRTTYHKRYSQNDGHLEMTCTLSPFGVSPSVLYERKLSRHSKLACGLTLNYPACVLVSKLRLKTSLNNYELNVVLCESTDEIARSVVYGVAFPYVMFQTARILFRRPLEKLSRYFDDSALEEQVDDSKREEAQRVINLMRSTAERIGHSEDQKHGLVIVEAKYGQMEGQNPSYPIPGERLIDVTIALQALVTESQLRIYTVKSQLAGFYDPCPGELKMLKVVYRFRDQLHAVVVPDELPLNIPLALNNGENWSDPLEGQMGKAPAEEPRAPSAPALEPEEEHSVQAQSSAASSTAPVNQTPPPNYGSTDSPQESLPPPPSYSEAIHCAAPPYVPKAPGPQHGQPIYPPPISGTGYILQAPTPDAAGQTRIIHTTTVITPVNGTACIHCLTGQVQNETDLCCLLCLILFAIFTFPMGLVLLCCIPCTVRQRCNRCRRLQ